MSKKAPLEDRIISRLPPLTPQMKPHRNTFSPTGSCAAVCDQVNSNVNVVNLRSSMWGESIEIDIGIAIEIDKQGHGMSFDPDSDFDSDSERVVFRPTKA